jgi:hypothetical protein
MKGKVNCTCGWSWNKSDSSAKDMYICHECGRDNSNNMKNGGWLDNYNDSQASAPEGMKGDGYSNVGRDYSPAWGGQFQEGGELPMAQDGKATRADSLDVYNRALKIDAYYNNLKNKGWYTNVKNTSTKSPFFNSKSLEKEMKEIDKESVRTYKNQIQEDPRWSFLKWAYPNVDVKAVNKKALNEHIKLTKGTKYASKDNYPMIIDPMAPTTVIDTRILPKERVEYTTNSKDVAEGRTPPGGTLTALYRYPPLSVMPFDILQKEHPELIPERIKKYGTEGIPESYLDKTKQTTKQNVLQKREPVQSLTPLQPIGIQNDFNIEATPLPVIRSEAKIPKSYKLRTQRYTMDGPREMDHLGYYNNQEASLEQLMKIQAEADAYNANIQKKYVDDLSDYNQIIQDRGKDRAGKIKMEVVATPNYQMGGKLKSNIPVIEDAGGYNEEGYWVPDWEAMTAQAKKLGAKKVKTKHGSLIVFDDNWEVIGVDDNPDAMQMGGNVYPVNYVPQAQDGVDMYDNPMLARRVDNTNIDRSYYDPRLNTMNIGSDYNMWHDEETGELLTGDDLKYHQDKLLAHENYHAMQHKEGRDNYDIAHSTDNEQWARMQKRPELMSTNAVWNNFYNRSDIENQQDYQDMINYFPESRILNEDLLFDKVLDGARYNNPSNAEGEAKFYEDTGVGFRNGGWLDGYDVAANGTTTEETTKPNKFAIVKSIIQDKKNGKSPFDINNIYNKALKNTEANAITKKQTEDFIKKLNVDTNQTKYKIKNETEDAVTKIDNTAVKKTNFDKDNKTYNNANTKEYKPEDISNLDIPSQVINQIDYVKYHDNPTQNFGVVDKENNVMYYVNQYGQIIGHENVVTGATNADKESAPSMLEYGKTANEYYDYLKNTNQRVTPAGKFTLHSNDNTSEGKPHSLWDRAISALPFTDDVKLNTLDDPSLMHALYNEMPWREEENKEYYDHRKESYGPTGNMFRMVSQYGVPSSKGLHGTGNENRIAALNNQGANKNLSNGCINVNGKTMCFDILKDKSNLYVLPEKEMETPTSKAIVKNKEEKYPPFYDKDKKVSREDIQNVKNTKAKISKIISDNNIKATPEEIEFATAVAQKETKGGESWGSKAESILPGFSSYGLYEQKESFPYLKGKSPNDESASTQAIIDFYRDMLTKYPELNNDSHKNEKLYSTYNSGRTDWNTNGIYHALEFRKISQALNEYKNGGGIIKDEKAQDGFTTKDKPKLGAGKYYTTTDDIVDWGTPEYEEAYNRGEVVTDEGGRSPIALKEVVVKGKKKKKWWEYDGGEEENPNDKRRRREDEWRKLTGTKEYKEEAKKQEIAYDKSIIADRKTRMVDAMNAQDVDIIGNPNWREVLATETQSTGDKFRLFPNDPHSFIDDWLNPGVMIGNMASSLGSAPLRAREEDSFMPYISSIGAPLLMGRFMGSGSINPFGKKLWTNQVSNRAFLNNMALGIPGMVEGAANLLTKLPSAARAIGSGQNYTLPKYMSLEAPKGNMYGENQVLIQQQRLLHPDIKAKFFENQAPEFTPSQPTNSLFNVEKTPKDFGNRITPKNYEDFVNRIHGSTAYDFAASANRKPHNLGVGNYDVPGKVFKDAPLNDLGKDIINAHEKNHGIFAGTLSKEMQESLLKPFGTKKAIPNYADKHQADEVLSRMGQFKNAVGIGDNQTFTLGHLNLIRKNYANSFLDNSITEMLAKIKPGSAGEKEFLKNMNKYAFGITALVTAGALDQQKEGGVVKGDQDGYRNPKNRGKVVEIKGSTMGTDGYDDTLYVVPDVGEPRIVYANTGNHEFPGATKFREYPMAKNGLRQEQKGLVNLDNLLNFTNYNKPQPGGWLSKYE